MAEPKFVCPSCKTEIRLTESLAAPLIAATRKQFEAKLAEQERDILSREQGILEKEKQIAKAKHGIEEQVLLRLSEEKARMVAEEAEKAKRVWVVEVEKKARELEEVQTLLRAKEEKLAQAQRTQAEFMKKQRELDDARREVELTVEKRIAEELEKVRFLAQKEAEERHKMRAMEREQLIASMQKKIEELKQKAEQGSQQLQGEVQELELEKFLADAFPMDSIQPVPKGEFGGDVLQYVYTQSGQACGLILWEAKRTKNWHEVWLSKLREDQRAAKAELAVLVSQVLPKGIDIFDFVDGIWVANPRVLLPLATSLRHALLQVSMAQQASAGQQTKTAMVYQYLTGAGFRQRIEAIVEAFSSMQEDLEKERKAMTKQWAKREMQIGKVVESTLGMYGDLQGIAGKSMQEIEGLEFPALEQG
ncbi:MAG: DUF2130 domain-containing protein [Proteobacteria bacterium]|nr:DUF2130 domain-containing protein [Cystobacterineae bacterium]MCL2258457.1 DUF2130 domain-containing protein [Cystobacterineae bacterium]MCL2315204.1 DUF2130 domain-containing protein [Pseudomonadota bacterium]